MLLYNTLSRKKEPFEPLTPGQVRMYVCGVTVYDLCHIGHARSAVVFDALVRRLRQNGLSVLFVRNFTDVDDKIIKRAHEEGIPPEAVSTKYIEAFHADMDQLGTLRADLEPKATEHIGEMIAMTQALIDKGHAYSTASGDVYFKVRSFEGYGKLSGRDVEDLQSGARIAPGEEKLDPLDFALWKAAKPGEPSWDSPWGAGRPGWHLECSAMTDKLLAPPFDIHGGGQDLIFPHHENEIAQSEAALGKPFARFWVHNGFVQIDAEKMSKSLGNFFTIRDILNDFQPETLRLFLLNKHYRSPIDYTLESMEETEKSLKRIYGLLASVEEELARANRSKGELPKEISAEFGELKAAFEADLDDDLNTAAALGRLFGVVRLAGRVLDDKGMRKSSGAGVFFSEVKAFFGRASEALGLFASDPAGFLAESRDVKARRKGIDVPAVEALLEKRLAAKKAKDFSAADAVRDELTALGVQVKDTPQGQAWEAS